jgi:hypothetical protein
MQEPLATPETTNYVISRILLKTVNIPITFVSVKEVGIA